MLENVLADIKAYYSRYPHYGFIRRIVWLIVTQEMYPVLVYRFGRWANHTCSVPIIKQAAQVLYFILLKITEVFLHVFISPEHEIGPGLRLEHFGLIGIVAKIGKNCRVSPHVIIGHAGGFKGGGVPTIGDNVYIGAGAKVLGEIKIGDNAIIGANAVVTSDIPDNAVAVGIPARVIKIRSESEVTRLS